ncbi:ATP-binding protein [Acidovorax sp.]|uniref:AlbA family DNA-binding domain-containing protein n=1 Tax=Acidovorax sp. TaxID=1872122 RepID=UPI00262E75E2|nr:ATP-binding protein [Acidovorax sp.]
MTDDEFSGLLFRGEGETLDFKVQCYDLKQGRGDLIKDILSMANTPRNGAAYIVLGVDWSPENGSQVVGLSAQVDDAELQNAFGRDRVQPTPRFTYSPRVRDGLQVGVIEIPAGQDGPYTPVKEVDGLQAGAVYYRRGTQNDRAVGTEHRRIVSWFQGGEVGLPDRPNQAAWQIFYEAVSRFTPQKRYLLAADRIESEGNSLLSALGQVPWRAVIDFDPASGASGLLSGVETTLSQHRVVHRVVSGDNRIHPDPGTHWFFARGLQGRQETLVLGDHRAWLKAYKSELGKQLSRLSASWSPSPVVAVLVWSDSKFRSHLRSLIEELYGSFGEAVEIVVVSNDSASFEGTVEELGATFVSLSLRSFCAGIGLHFSEAGAGSGERYVLPTASGAGIEVPTDIWLWLSEDLELAHRAIGFDGDDSAEAFRRGGDIGWRNLQLGHDCDRDSTLAARSQVEEDLRKRQTVRINFYHAPGSGGTTIGRRIAWDLHSAYPVTYLTRCSPRDTAERIGKVAVLTESSVLVVVDGGRHSEREIDDLFEFLRAGQVPVVLLQVLRRFQPQTAGKRQFWLGEGLSRIEADRFRDVYTNAVPERREELTQLASRSGSSVYCNAFFFGLTGYGKDFRGLRPYVARRVEGLTTTQKRFLAFLAIGHYYGQQSIPVNAFASMFQLPATKALSVNGVFSGDSAPSLDLVVEVAGGEWRTAHQLIALEILQQVLSPEDSNIPQTVWRQNLSLWAKTFADFCRGDAHVSSDQLLELVRRVFIYRDNVEVLGTERSGQKGFSRLIQDIPSEQGRLEILRHLTDRFPEEAHIHAHLARLLSLSGEHKEALESIDFAISLQMSDHLLHHMRGMVLRQRMKGEVEAGNSVESIVETAVLGSASFGRAREIGPDEAHGFISEIQLLIDLIDGASKIRKLSPQKLLVDAGSPQFLKGSLDRIEDLLDQVQRLYVGEQPSHYVLDCRARVQRIYGDFQSALQDWDSLLSRPGVAKCPVRRQIVWTILRRHDGNWDQLGKKEVERIRTLLEENLAEEPYDSTSLRMWLRSIRYLKVQPSLDSVIEKVSYWKANTGTLDAVFYLYVLHTLRAMKGSHQSLADAEQALEECRQVTRFRRDRTRSFEWVGSGDGLGELIHQGQLGDWKDDFWEHRSSLVRVPGTVASIDAPQKGAIELAGGVKAFFVPGKSDLHFGRDENASVTCYVGFSYDGPRAWDVIKVQ